MAHHNGTLGRRRARTLCVAALLAACVAPALALPTGASTLPPIPYACVEGACTPDGVPQELPGVPPLPSPPPVPGLPPGVPPPAPPLPPPPPVPGLPPACLGACEPPGGAGVCVAGVGTDATSSLLPAFVGVNAGTRAPGVFSDQGSFETACCLEDGAPPDCFTDRP